MHELAIAQQVVRTVLAEMNRIGATRVRVIDVEIGTLEGLSAESLRGAFDLESKDTPIEGVELRVALVASVAVCPRCGASRELTAPLETHGREPFVACPRCGIGMAFHGDRGFVVRSAAMVLPDP